MLPCISPQVDSLSVYQLFIEQPVELPNILDSLVSTTCAYTYVWWVRKHKIMWKSFAKIVKIEATLLVL